MSGGFFSKAQKYYKKTNTLEGAVSLSINIQ